MIKHLRVSVLFLLFAAFPARAGKLAEGVLGIPWGFKEAFPQPEAASCTHQPEVGIEWTCTREIGEKQVTVSFAWKYGHFYAVVINAESFDSCNVLMNVLTSAWGKSRPKSQYLTGAMDDRIWYDGNAIATWEYNKFSNKCSATAVKSSEFTAVQQKDREAAKAASEGI